MDLEAVNNIFPKHVGSLFSWRTMRRNIFFSMSQNNHGLPGPLGNVLFIEIKLRRSKLVRGTFVVQANAIKFVECNRNMADVQTTAIWLARSEPHHLCRRMNELNYLALIKEARLPWKSPRARETWKTVEIT